MAASIERPPALVLVQRRAILLAEDIVTPKVPMRFEYPDGLWAQRQFAGATILGATFETAPS
jgi:hypothetical protein